MKIDIHMHTKRIKKGDAPSREISSDRFYEIVSGTEVRICAITNHNHFDETQYLEIVEKCRETFQTWPGVELDINEDGKKGHLIVIVNPRNAHSLATQLSTLTDGISSELFSIDIDQIIASFDDLDPIYVAHYDTKKPSITDDDIQKLTNGIRNKSRVLKEATNSISAGIYITHGHKSIYGSDIQDWNDYSKISQTLPDLRLPVESYEQFCLLLERDDSTIKTILNKKTKETITLNPFKEDDYGIEIDIYNDINVLFGSKGTGKTEILKALSDYYNKNGYKTEVYESSSVNLESKYDIKGSSFTLEKTGYEIEPCTAELNKIRSSTDVSVTSLKKYYEYFSSTETSKISKRIAIKNFSPEDFESSNKRFSEIKELKNNLSTFRVFLESNELYKKTIGEGLFGKLISLIEEVTNKVLEGFENAFVASRTIRFYNNLIETFVSEIAKKTGQPEKPVKTGFLDYARNRIELELALKKVITSMNQKLEPINVYVGDLGEKGKLFCKTEVVIHDGTISDGSLKPVTKVTKRPQKDVAKAIQAILNKVYTDELYERISALNRVENGSSIASVNDLVSFKKFFEIKHKPYKPSNGESAMILLQQELNKKSDIFLIDEPEKSLGNDYINDFIVPLLKEHAYSGKRIVVATHDANIAVRTLPYNSIYRSHAIERYYTHQGNPFISSLTCTDPGVKELDWKEISMRTLEGGEEAFGERGKIYARN